MTRMLKAELPLRRCRTDARPRLPLDRKQAEGKSRLEALRALKRHLARVVFGLLREAGRPSRARQGARRKGPGVRGGKGPGPSPCLRLRSWFSCPTERSPTGCNTRRAENQGRPTG